MSYLFLHRFSKSFWPIYHYVIKIAIIFTTYLTTVTLKPLASLLNSIMIALLIMHFILMIVQSIIFLPQGVKFK